MIRLDTLKVDGFKNLIIKNLSFPPEGNILITGQNESGKSSVFEAIFFALTSELLVKEKGGYIDAIAFDKNAAYIDLAFYKDNIPARIIKTISKTRNGSTLDVDFYIDGEQQEGSNTEKLQKIEDFVEFDADVLRNSCFVKQKELEGYFDEDLAKRKKIIGKLLNLEKFSLLEESYKKDIKNKKLIKEYYENRLIIENNDKEYQKINKELQIVGDKKKEFDKVNSQIEQINKYFDELDGLKHKIDEDNKKIDELNDQIKKSDSKIEEIKKYEEISKKIDKIEHSVEIENKNCDQCENEIKNKNERKGTLESLIIEIQKNTTLLKQLEEKLQEEIKDYADLEKLVKINIEIGDTAKKLELDKKEVEHIKNNIERVKEDIDGTQTTIKRQLRTSIDSLKAQIEEYEINLNTLTQIKDVEEIAEGDQSKRKRFSFLIKTSPIYGTMIVAGIFLSVFIHMAFLSLVGLGIIIGFLFLLAEFEKGPLKSLLTKRRIAKKVKTPEALIQNLEARIENLKININNTLKDMALSEELEPSKIRDSIQIISSEIIDIPNILDPEQIKSHYSRKIPLINELQTKLNESIESLLKYQNDLGPLVKNIEKYQKIIEQNKSNLPENYQQDYGLIDKHLNQLSTTMGETKSELKNTHEFLKKNSLDDTNKKLKIITEEINKLLEKSRGIKEKVVSLERDSEELLKQIPEDYRNINLSTLKDKITTTISDQNKLLSRLTTENNTNWNNFTRSIQNFYDASFSPSSIRIEPEILKNREFEKIKKFLNESNTKIIAIKNKIEDQIQDLNPTNQEIKIDRFLTEFVKEKQAKLGVLENQINQAGKYTKNSERQKSTAKIIQEYENKKGTLTEKYQNISDEVSIINAAIRILSDGEIELSQKVIPKTIDNLTKILPILTADRYKDATITSDYKIEIFDSKKGDYVKKVLFSGGTNDQIALGIRLAFAIATMKKTDTNESFIFLDEPLGFFDDERRSALIDFLTHGLIADKFGQRIVISNYLEIKPYFDYVIELANGSVISETVTGSLDTTQYESEYIPIGDLDVLEIIQDQYLEEDGYSVLQMHLKNISEIPITNIKLEKSVIDVSISPIFIAELKPNTNQYLEISCRKIVLEEADLNLEAHFKIHYSEDEPSLSKQYIEIKPKYTN